MSINELSNTPSTDAVLIARLRDTAVIRATDIHEAADRIEQLVATCAAHEQLLADALALEEVRALVEALEKLARLGNGDLYGNSDGNMIARTALAKLKGGA